MSIVTVMLLAILIFLSRHELVRAWELLEKVNIWILLIALPLSALSYLAAGEMIFSYLRQKKLINDIKHTTLMRLSLELNFVNHVLPSGGLSGISYMNWRLSKYGVPSGRATMAQAVRYAMGFAALITLLAISVIAVTVDGSINRWTILMSSSLVFFLTIITLLGMYVLKSHERMEKAADWVTKVTNNLVERISFGAKRNILKLDKVRGFFEDMHDDFNDLKRDRRVLLRPYLWGIFFTIMEVSIFATVFWALGTPVNPAPILIAYGIASFAGYIIITPGGAGAYEAIMVIVLAMAGIAQSQAIAAIILARMIILLVTIVLGYIFYQLAVLKYGKHTDEPTTEV